MEEPSLTDNHAMRSVLHSDPAAMRAPDVVDGLCAAAGRALGADMVWVAHRGLSTIIDDAYLDFDSGWSEADALEAAELLTSAIEPSPRTVVVADSGSGSDDREKSAARRAGIGFFIHVPLTATRGAAPAVLVAAGRRPAPGFGDAEGRLLQLLADSIRHADGRSAADDAIQVRERIAGALNGGQLRSVFQPIVDLAGGRPTGVEALARFRSAPSRPDLWFADAESVGMGVALELAAVRHGLTALERLPDDLYVSVNASPGTLMTHDFRRTISSVPAHRLVIEITEHARVVDYDGLAAVLESLRSAGVRIAVDDVGAGFSSFAHVLRLQPDILKLDISITRGIDFDPARRALARGVVGVARDLGATVVAEGIETLGELNTALDVGVDSGQGFFLARPGELPIPSDYPRPSARIITERSAKSTNDDLLGYVVRSWIRTNDLQTVARSLLALVQKRTGLQTAYLNIANPDNGDLETRYVHNTGPAELPEGLSLPYNETLCKLAREAGIRWTSDVPKDLPGCRVAEAFGVLTFLSVPMVRHDGTDAGTLCAASTEPRQLSESVLDEIELMAHLLADRINYREPVAGTVVEE